MPPLTAWIEGEQQRIIEMPAYPEQLDVLVGIPATRTLWHYGIENDCLRYNSDVLQLLRIRMGGYSRAELLNRSEAAKFLSVSQDLFDALIRNELLSPLPRTGKRAERLFLKQDVSVFTEKFIFSSHLARTQSVGSQGLRKKLFLLGVEGISIKYRYATAVLYRKDEIRSHIEL